VTGSYYILYERTDKGGISDPVKGMWGYKSRTYAVQNNNKIYLINSLNF
jgi:hypothetical protein